MKSIWHSTSLITARALLESIRFQCRLTTVLRTDDAHREAVAIARMCDSALSRLAETAANRRCRACQKTMGPDSVRVGKEWFHTRCAEGFCE